MPGGGRVTSAWPAARRHVRADRDATPGRHCRGRSLPRLFTPFASTKADRDRAGAELCRASSRNTAGTVTRRQPAPAAGPCFTRCPPRRGGRSDADAAGDRRRADRRLLVPPGRSAGRTSRCSTAGPPPRASSRSGHDGPDVVVLDLQLPDRVRPGRVPRTCGPSTRGGRSIFITAHGTTETAIEAMKQRGVRLPAQAARPGPIAQVLGRAFEAARLMRVPAVLPGRGGPATGSSAAARPCRRCASRSAASPRRT